MSAGADPVRVVSEVVQVFGLPPPKVVVGNFSNAFYDTSTKTVHIPAWAPPDLATRMAIHEATHYVVDALRKQFGDYDEERFAQMFEEVFYTSRFKGYAWVAPCNVCGFPVLFHSGSDTATCPKCYTTYRRKFYPSPGLGKAVALGLLSAVAAYTIADYAHKNPEVRARFGAVVEDPKKLSALVSGLVGFLVGLM